MKNCTMRTKTKATVAVSLLLALCALVWFDYTANADPRYLLMHMASVSANEKSTAQINPNSVTDRYQRNDDTSAATDESHPQAVPTLILSSATGRTTVLPNTLQISVTEIQPSSQTEIETEPVPGQRHIIFLETRCVLNNSITDNLSGLRISKRQACAVASAAKTNPNTKVYLLYTCSIIGNIGDSPEYVKQMLSYPNVRIWKLVVSDYITGTPLENWNFMEKVQSSKWPVIHASDILRYTTLWKYGGTYLDLDFVMQKSLTDLGSNFVVAQSEDEIANGALNFDMDVIGRRAAHLCLADIRRNFNGKLWVQNGPWVIWRVLKVLCGTKRVTNTTRKQCSGFAVLSPSVFYAINYQSWRLFFEASRSEEALKKVEGSFGVHVWNMLSSHAKISVGSKQAYGLLAQKYCPRVYSNSGLEF